MKVTKYSGESVLLPCSCFNLQAQGTRWFKDNVRIDPTKPADRIHMTNQDFPGNLSLLISDLTKKDEGIYKCEGYQNSYRDFTLTVTGCTLMEQLTTLQIKRSSGESALLPCLCSSLRAKPESVRWTTTSRSGSMDTEISNTTGPYRGRVQMFNRHSPGNISLLISDLSEKDQGIYICVVDKHYTKHVHLLVKVPSVKNLDCAPLQSASLQILRRPGECVLLPCSCTDLKATPKSLTWMTTSESQSPDGGWKIISTTDVSYRGRLETFNHTSSGNLSLGLSDLTQEDHGSYRCLINGQKGGQITLLVLDAKSRGGTTSPLCIASFISVLLLVLLLGGLVFIFWRYKGQRKTQMGNDRQRRGTDQEREMSVTSTYEDLQHRYSAGQMYSTIGQNTGVQVNDHDGGQIDLSA